MHVLVMAKEPIAGRVKTRLCPPCEPHQAATLAEAALADVLEAATTSGADRVVLALDGRPGEWCPPGVEVIAQATGSFDLRLAAAWDAAGGPGVQIGMDTPQVTTTDLDEAMAQLVGPKIDATIGPADDGGWWLIGLRRPDHRVFAGLPMSRADTCRRQLERLTTLDLRWTLGPTIRDVDDIDDAMAVAAAAPHTRFAARFGELSSSWVVATVGSGR